MHVSVVIYTNMKIGATTKQKVSTLWVHHTYSSTMNDKFRSQTCHKHCARVKVICHNL